MGVAKAFDSWTLYELMLTSRLFEEAVARLWDEGAISGEMHLGTGEEGIVAGVVSHLRDGDAMALDHRGTAPLLMRGVDPVALLRELLGRSDGLCSGQGGHMHLFSPDHLAASSGIVGSSGPAAAGFALAGQHLRPGSVSVAFFGEGATNQGMMMEAFNLAVAWTLPVIFVCKDNQWAITTESPSVTGGDILERARSFGMPGIRVDGWNLEAVYEAAGEAVDRARDGKGPTFLHAECIHLEGHFLGDPLVRVARNPVAEMTAMTGPLLKSAATMKGTSMKSRATGLLSIVGLIGRAFRERGSGERDPIANTRGLLRADPERLNELEARVTERVSETIARALGEDDGASP